MVSYKRFPAPARAALLISLMLAAFASLTAAQADSGTSCVFTNPIKAAGQDPSVVFHDGFYYLVQSEGPGLVIRKSAKISDLGTIAPVTIYTPPSGTEYSQELWAPELVYVQGGWYIYYAADDGVNAHHRMYVLQADTQDPLGTWTWKGKVYHDDATDKWAIDGSVFEYQDTLYMVWSGWPGDTGDFPQNLYIAPMKDPLTVTERHLISEPDQPWERSRAAINEGPEPFLHNGQLSIVYSGDFSITTAYNLGLLALTGDDLLQRSSWTKSGPIFRQIEKNGVAVYGPGHNSMPIPSPDGKEDWFLYHAKSTTSDGWEDRQLFAKPMTWDERNLPVLGEPVTTAIPTPSGEPCGEAARYTLDGNLTPADASAPTGKVNGSEAWAEGKYGQGLVLDGKSFVDLTTPLLSTTGSFSVAAWVYLDSTDQTMSLISQDGGISSNFALQFSAEAGNRLAFTAFTPMGEVDAQALSSFTPEAKRWYLVAGVRDALRQEVRLYVDGKLEATAPTTVTWDARGDTILGASRVKTKRATFLVGRLDDVTLYNGAITDAQAQALLTR